MKIERIKIKDEDIIFEEKFDKKDKIICVLDNEIYYGSIYRNNFLYNILNLLKIDKRERRGGGTLTECDVSILFNDKYTIRVECTKEESFENDKKGYIATLKRSYLLTISATYSRSSRVLTEINCGSSSIISPTRVSLSQSRSESRGMLPSR